MGSKYRLGERIGGGGMAEVFRGTLVGVEGFARPVAIKRMLPALSADAAFAEMFKNEARLASLLAHSNIVSVLDFDRDDEARLFLVMELVDGRDLRELQDGGRLPVPVSAFLIDQVLRALSYAHELTHQGRPLGMVHRDVSPHNVLISWNGAVKLSDFGIAKAMGASGVSRTGSLKGKVGYMSPEQAHGLPLDGRSDVFAVGVMFHELLTGERLFGGATEAEVLSRMLAQPIDSPRRNNPDVSDDLAAVCMGMLERDRDRRFASARAAQEALLNCDVVSARGQSELSKLIALRFPQDAPARGDDSGPVAVPGADATAPIRGGHGARAAMEAPTRTEMPGHKTGTPTAAGERPVVASMTLTDPHRRGGRLGLVLAVLAAAAIGAGAVAFALGVFDNKDGGADTTTLANAPAGTADAGIEATPEPAATDAAVVAAVVPDAAPAAAPEPEPESDRAKKKRSDRKKKRDKKRDKPIELEPRPLPEERKPDEPKREEPKPKEEVKLGALYVRVHPWANVKIRGHGEKTTPATWSLPEGKYKVTLWNEELGKSETKTVTIVSGKPVTISHDWSK